MLNCTFGSNAVPGLGTGGAIYNLGTLRVSGSTFRDNRADYNGGAIVSHFMLPVFSPGPVLVTNCTFTGNISPFGAAISGGGTNRSYVVNCTLAGSTGQGIQGRYTLINSIVANNSVSNCGSSVTDGGHNLSSDGSCGFTSGSSVSNIDPGLGPLADNGGPTLTMALLAGSPATDAADPAAGLPTDQRGYPRPYGSGSDIGALETTLIGPNPGAFQFNTSAYHALESDPELVITVVRVGGAFGTATVQFATADLGATAGGDYFATNGTLVFAHGEVQKSFSVRLRDDTAQEADKMFHVTLSAPTGGATLGNPASATVTIVDDETPAVVSTCDDASLRSAIAAKPVVTFGCDGVIGLTNTLVISRDTELAAAGRDVTLSGGNAVRLFLVQPGATLTLRSLALVDGLALGTNGNLGQSGEPAQGGAICNSNGVVKAYDCEFLRNRAAGRAPVASHLSSGRAAQHQEGRSTAGSAG